MHPLRLNQAILQPKDLQKSDLTVEDCMAPIWEKHHIMEKRRIVLITQAREIVTNYVQSKGKIVTAATYNNIVVGTATKMVKVYLEGCAAKEASQYPSSMLESSVPKVMTDEASATKETGGTISPQSSSSACAMCSSSPMASSTWSIEYPRTVDKAVTSDRATGPLTRSSESYFPLLPQITHSQSGYN